MKPVDLILEAAQAEAVKLVGKTIKAPGWRKWRTVTEATFEMFADDEAPYPVDVFIGIRCDDGYSGAIYKGDEVQVEVA